MTRLFPAASCLLLVVLTFACGDDQQRGCEVDSDCRGSRVCDRESGACVDPGAATAECSTDSECAGNEVPQGARPICQLGRCAASFVPAEGEGEGEHGLVGDYLFGMHSDLSPDEPFLFLLRVGDVQPSGDDLVADAELAPLRPDFAANPRTTAGEWVPVRSLRFMQNGFLSGETGEVYVPDEASPIGMGGIGLMALSGISGHRADGTHVLCGELSGQVISPAIVMDIEGTFGAAHTSSTDLRSVDLLTGCPPDIRPGLP